MASGGEELVFVSERKSGLKAAGAIVLGCVLVLATFEMVIRAASVPESPDHPMAPGLNSGFIGTLFTAMIGAFAILWALAKLRMTHRVVVDSAGVRVQSRLSRRVVKWSDIGSVARSSRTLLFDDKKFGQVELVSRSGKTLAIISDTFGDDFERLASELVNRANAQAGSLVYNPEKSEERRIGKEKRHVRRAAWIFLVFSLGNVAALIAGINEEIHTRRYRTEGVQVDATVVKTWIVKVTPYVEYSFRDASGHTFDRQAMMFDGPAWDLVQMSKTVPVVYLPSAPEWNRLVSGEDPGAEFGGNSLYLFAGGAVMFGGIFFVAFKGYDLKTEDGVTSLFRNGKVIKQWQKRESGGV